MTTKKVVCKLELPVGYWKALQEKAAAKGEAIKDYASEILKVACMESVTIKKGPRLEDLPLRSKWYYNDDGTWHAMSEMMADGSPLQYWIKVNADGKFSVNESDEELIGEYPPFESLHSAMMFCNGTELSLLGVMIQPKK